MGCCHVPCVHVLRYVSFYFVSLTAVPKRYLRKFVGNVGHKTWHFFRFLAECCALPPKVEKNALKNCSITWTRTWNGPKNLFVTSIGKKVHLTWACKGVIVILGIRSEDLRKSSQSKKHEILCKSFGILHPCAKLTWLNENVNRPI